MGLVIDEAVFGEVATMLDLTVEVRVTLSSDVPADLREKGCAVDKGLKKVIEADDFAGVTGSYLPDIGGAKNRGQCPERPLGHEIWVRSNQPLADACVSLVHEMTHAMQYENFGVLAAMDLMERFNDQVGYANNPLELEADSMGEFIVRNLGLRPLRYEE